jgi:hypothetical protein
VTVWGFLITREAGITEIFNDAKKAYAALKGD